MTNYTGSTGGVENGKQITTKRGSCTTDVWKALWEATPPAGVGGESLKLLKHQAEVGAILAEKGKQWEQEAYETIL